MTKHNIIKSLECLACGKQIKVRIVPGCINDTYFGPLYLDILLFHVVPLLGFEVGKLAELNVRLNSLFWVNFRFDEIEGYVVREMKWSVRDMLYEYWETCDFCSQRCVKRCDLIRKICREPPRTPFVMHMTTADRGLTLYATLRMHVQGEFERRDRMGALAWGRQMEALAVRAWNIRHATF